MKLSTIVALICIVAAFAYAFSQETPFGRVRGQALHSATGRPVANVHVILIAQTKPAPTRSGGRAPGGSRWFRTRTDGNGEFALSRLPAGVYQAMAYGRDVSMAPATVNVSEDGRTRLSLMLRSQAQASATPRPKEKAGTKKPDKPEKPDKPSLPPGWVLPPQPVRDSEAVRIRTLDIVRARNNLSPELYHIVRANNRSGLPLSLVLAQAGAETSFRPWLQGEAQEMGLFQLKLVTANDQGLGKFAPQQLLDPALNTRVATTYLGWLVEYFGDVRIALAAYNQGPGNTERRGLFPRAQIYADAILWAAYHHRFQARLRALDPGFKTERPRAVQRRPAAGKKPASPRSAPLP